MVEAVLLSYFQVGGRTPVSLKYLARRWILLSTRISLNLASLSFLFLSRCFLMETAFDQVIAVLGQLWGHALALQDAQDLVAGDEPDLRNTVRVPEDNTNLGRGKALLGQLEDLVLDLIAGDLQPLRNRPPVRKCRLAD